MAIDGRSRLGRRVRDFAEDYAAALGGWGALSDVLAATVRRAAELMALAEESRAEALRSGIVDPVGLVRLEGEARRAVRALGPDRKPAPAGLSLVEYLAVKAAAQETATGEFPEGVAGTGNAGHCSDEGAV
jgi:hypothetical protein